MRLGTLGHETTGVVEKVGFGVKGFAMNDAVLVAGIRGGAFTAVADAPPKGRPKWGVTFIRPYGATTRDTFEFIALAQKGRLKADVVRYPLVDAPSVLGFSRRGKFRAALLSYRKAPGTTQSWPMRTTSFPKFLPSSNPMSAVGAFSRPSTMSSRYFIAPSASHVLMSLAKAA
jgi:hypothetical protein